MRLERRAGPVLRDLQPHTPNSSEQRWDARSIWTVNEGDSLEHQYIPAKGTTANSVSPFILLLAKCHHLFPTWVRSQIFWILKIIFIRRRNWKLMFIFSVPSPFFTDVQRVHWAQGGSCYQGQLLFAPNSKWNFLCGPPKLLLVSTSLCVVWHASCQPVPSLHLLLCCLHSSVIHADTATIAVPCVCRQGQVLAISCRAAPLQAVLPVCWALLLQLLILELT